MKNKRRVWHYRTSRDHSGIQALLLSQFLFPVGYVGSQELKIAGIADLRNRLRIWRSVAGGILAPFPLHMSSYGGIEVYQEVDDLTSFPQYRW